MACCRYKGIFVGISISAGISIMVALVASWSALLLASVLWWHCQCWHHGVIASISTVTSIGVFTSVMASLLALALLPVPASLLALASRHCWQHLHHCQDCHHNISIIAWPSEHCWHWPSLPALAPLCHQCYLPASVQQFCYQHWYHGILDGINVTVSLPMSMKCHQCHSIIASVMLLAVMDGNTTCSF